mmetsp:Transcript_22197/g.55948  ORF Transcript_22197/g.55948 Transcript_22197/m.55948 type:complete len:116 (-) Transcript_22197:232-579(-)|eukprot:CAMPEP_0179000872 /NCGR_PEP_ID=MMETSP0795-20121207/10965_1 /TAXON_ID=88552 /ORGANISM="Amoebophrya sp., Strain Ameob2" /LENGTH=115 /DNA_ID=CAMNT_0020694021 /DNA_START=309 /DNA_END=656 /DNA_ORIENTATION=-
MTMTEGPIAITALVMSSVLMVIFLFALVCCGCVMCAARRENENFLEQHEAESAALRRLLQPQAPQQPAGVTNATPAPAYGGVNAFEGQGQRLGRDSVNSPAMRSVASTTSATTRL